MPNYIVSLKSMTTEKHLISRSLKLQTHPLPRTPYFSILDPIHSIGDPQIPNLVQIKLKFLPYCVLSFWTDLQADDLPLAISNSFLRFF